jgi:hypothetical protein
MDGKKKFEMGIGIYSETIEIEGVPIIHLTYPRIKESVSFLNIIEGLKDVNFSQFKIDPEKAKNFKNLSEEEQLKIINNNKGLIGATKGILLKIIDYVMWCVEKEYDITEEQKAILESKLVNEQNMDYVMEKTISFISRFMSKKSDEPKNTNSPLETE